MGRAIQKNKLVVAVLSVVILLGGGYQVYKDNHKTAVPASSQTSKSNAPISLASYDGEAGKTALETLKLKYTITTKTYSFGEQVLSINGTDGNGPKYWTFYINGKMAEVGAGSYTAKAGDKFEWRLE